MPRVNLNEFRQALEGKRREFSSGTSDREEILIEKTADEFDRIQLYRNEPGSGNRQSRPRFKGLERRRSRDIERRSSAEECTGRNEIAA